MYPSWYTLVYSLSDTSWYTLVYSLTDTSLYTLVIHPVYTPLLHTLVHPPWYTYPGRLPTYLHTQGGIYTTGRHIHHREAYTTVIPCYSPLKAPESLYSPVIHRYSPLRDSREPPILCYSPLKRLPRAS